MIGLYCSSAIVCVPTLYCSLKNMPTDSSHLATILSESQQRSEPICGLFGGTGISKMAYIPAIGPHYVGDRRVTDRSAIQIVGIADPPSKYTEFALDPIDLLFRAG